MEKQKEEVGLTPIETKVVWKIATWALAAVQATSIFLYFDMREQVKSLSIIDTGLWEKKLDKEIYYRDLGRIEGKLDVQGQKMDMLLELYYKHASDEKKVKPP